MGIDAILMGIPLLSTFRPQVGMVPTPRLI